MIKKRMLSALLAAMLAVGLTSCGTNTESDIPEEGDIPKDVVEENYEEIFVRDDGFEFSSEKGITEYAPLNEQSIPETPRAACPYSLVPNSCSFHPSFQALSFSSSPFRTSFAKSAIK